MPRPLLLWLAVPLTACAIKVTSAPADVAAGGTDAGEDAPFTIDAGLDAPPIDRPRSDVGADRGMDVAQPARPDRVDPGTTCPPSCATADDCARCNAFDPPGTPAYCCVLGLCLYMGGPCREGGTSYPDWEDFGGDRPDPVTPRDVPPVDLPLSGADVDPDAAGADAADADVDAGADAAGAGLDAGAAMDAAPD